MSPLENSIVEYTGGGVSFSSEETKELKELIKASEYSTKPLYRVEEVSNVMLSLKQGDTFESDIQSFSKSYNFAERLADGSDDGAPNEPLMLKIIGNNKSLNIQGYSYFSEQQESLVFGKFKVKKVSNIDFDGNIVRVLEIEQYL